MDACAIRGAIKYFWYRNGTDSMYLRMVSMYIAFLRV